MRTDPPVVDEGVDVQRLLPPLPQRPRPAAASILAAVWWFVAGHGLRQFASFGSLIALGAMLPPKAFGTVTAGMVIIGTGTLLLGAGTRGAIITSERLDGDKLFGAFAFNLLSGVAFAAATALVAQPVLDVFAKGSDAAVLRVLAMSVPLYALSIVPLAVLQKQMQFKRHAAITASSAVVSSVVAVAAALFGAGVWALVIRQVLLHAMTAVLGWAGVRGTLPPRTGTRGAASWRPRFSTGGGMGFLVLAVADFVAYDADYLIVGKFTDATQLGLYSLAFTLAFAPLTQFSWQVGGVLFPATAATPDRAVVARRTLKGVRLLALVMLPLVAPAVVLAPTLLPAVLGPEWREMVFPFQVLFAVGAVHSVINVIGESLSGTGNIGARATWHVAWAVAVVVALFVLVPVAGPNGAAVAHLVTFVPLLGLYVFVGTRRIGTSARELAKAVRGIALAILGQASAMAAGLVLLRARGVDGGIAAAVVSVVGLGLVLVLLAVDKSRPLHEVLRIVKAARRPAEAPMSEQEEGSVTDRGGPS